MVPLTIRPVEAFRLDGPEQDPAIREHIAQARIFFTGGVLTLALLVEEPKAPGTANTQPLTFSLQISGSSSK